MLSRLALVLSLLAPSAALASPRHDASVSVKSATASVKSTRADVVKARAAAKLASHRLKLAKARASYAKSLARLQLEQWISDCVDERNGPVDGVSVEQALAICELEVPSAAELASDPDLQQAINPEVK